MNAKHDIAFNKQAHDKVAKRYEKIHTEIYNEIEQQRLHEALKTAVSSVQSTATEVSALDVGCGAGNLSAHLLDLGVQVTAADVSEGFLQLVKNKYPAVNTHLLNGEDLQEIDDARYDVVATYSVLHHIPDYLLMVEEMCRVLKPGGVLYIDHEKNETFWNQDQALLQFYNEQRYSDIHRKIVRKLKNFLNPMWYVGKYRRYKDPRYQEEGDIHVWPDDHIEWAKIRSLATTYNVEVVKEYDFLHFNSKYNAAVYNKYVDQTSDMKAMILRKKI